ncbi:hypothetical protein [Thiomonas sp.]
MYQESLTRLAHQQEVSVIRAAIAVRKNGSQWETLLRLTGEVACSTQARTRGYWRQTEALAALGHQARAYALAQVREAEGWDSRRAA